MPALAGAMTGSAGHGPVPAAGRILPREKPGPQDRGLGSEEGMFPQLYLPWFPAIRLIPSLQRGGERRVLVLSAAGGVGHG